MQTWSTLFRGHVWWYGSQEATYFHYSTFHTAFLLWINGRLLSSETSSWPVSTRYGCPLLSSFMNFHIFVFYVCNTICYITPVWQIGSGENKTCIMQNRAPELWYFFLITAEIKALKATRNAGVFFILPKWKLWKNLEEICYAQGKQWLKKSELPKWHWGLPERN